jgi:hypothetical protein
MCLQNAARRGCWCGVSSPSNIPGAQETPKDLICHWVCAVACFPAPSCKYKYTTDYKYINMVPVLLLIKSTHVLPNLSNNLQFDQKTTAGA